MWDRLLIYLFTNKLDKYTRREWELFRIEGDLPTISDFNKFLKQRCELLKKLEVSNVVHDNTKEKVQFKGFNNKFNNNKRNAFVSTYQAGSGALTCYFCKGKHTIFRCEKFLNLSPAIRLPEIRKLSLCKNCLRPGHDIMSCRHSGCKACGGRHNSLLHVNSSRDTRASSDNTRENNNHKQSSDNCRTINNDNRTLQSTCENHNNTQVESSHTCFSEKIMTSQVLLSTALVNIKDSQGNVHECRALLDNGSQSNFVTSRFCEKLNISMESVNFKIIGVGQAVSKLNNRVKLNISSCTSDFNSIIDCLVLENITDKLPTTSFNKNILKLPKDIKLAGHTYNRAREIDLLIGSSVFWEILQLDRIQLEDSKIVLQETKLGWILGGVISSTSSQVEKHASNFSSELSQEQAIDKILLKFWEIEDVHSSVKTILSEEEQYCENYFKNTFKRSADNKFIVSIPFKENLTDLGDSRKSALQRYFSQESRLLKNPELKRDYDMVMQEYLQSGHMSAIDEEGEHQLAYYMPHHAVVHETSKTTRVRVVFDASMKSESGLSLNEVQCVGPTLQDDLFSIVLRFRKYQFVMTADISKMYRMIQVSPEQRKLQRIFWRQNAADDLKCYQLNTVTYGTASAPYLAVRCLTQLASEHEKDNPKASESIKRSLYMDDYLEGADSEHKLLTLQAQVTSILASAGFQLRKWLCNKRRLLTKFQVDTSLESSVLNINNGETNKTLGILWDSKSDSIKYSLPVFKTYQAITKRVILSSISQIFYPLVGPIVIVLKLLMQSLWQGRFDWDENLPEEIVNVWLNFKDDLMKITYLTIPRMVTVSTYVSVELHEFGDASQKAYGCCIYIRCKVQSGQYISKLLCSKSRVAPVKTLLTIPRQ
ncbi:uncharacterized protein [Diabrotica undecimpunctata]|uniref:uncharacterized protein n=1 Tax=Diabrotica undecimpunctata TaxID=50387 RepID=UPI003B63A792